MATFSTTTTAAATTTPPSPRDIQLARPRCFFLPPIMQFADPIPSYGIPRGIPHGTLSNPKSHEQGLELQPQTDASA
ncbi:hypothetical protein C8034_v004755 [Colletotrichum sidae]|uniref:Uncharacterized protein n=1 Tax=Colletotrichum sidae TaxID=1347389 RepID=A0A4R8T7U8_9PEZI|nr:hypothetical protein C8034_v004755 [Colletotrichum sidae]